MAEASPTQELQIFADWLDACEGADRASMLEVAMRGHLRRSFTNGSYTNPGPAIEEAFDGLIRPWSEDFLPAYDANPGLVVFTDEGGMTSPDSVARAVLSVLLVQHWCLFPKGGGADFLGDGRGISLRGADVDASAGRIIAALRAIYEIELDVEGLEFTRPGGIAIEWAGAQPECRSIVAPKEGLPPRDVYLAAVSTLESKKPADRRRELLERLAASSPSAREALRAIGMAATGVESR